MTDGFLLSCIAVGFIGLLGWAEQIAKVGKAIAEWIGVGLE